jgi:hypothetical protein
VQLNGPNWIYIAIGNNYCNKMFGAASSDLGRLLVESLQPGDCCGIDTRRLGCS